MPTKVKICGITNIADATVATEAGADYLGFIFFKKSPRYIAPQAAATIIRRVKEGASVKFIGVFVNETRETVEEILAEADLDYAQIHGDEPPAFVAALHRRGFKALRPTSAAEAQADAEWYADLGPENGPQLLIDAYDPAEYGGTGKKADWHTAAGLAAVYPRLVLAGGLTPENVATAIQTAHPWGVDVSSGVEARPGQKDPDKVVAFVAAAKGAS